MWFSFLVPLFSCSLFMGGIIIDGAIVVGNKCIKKGWLYSSWLVYLGTISLAYTWSKSRPGPAELAEIQTIYGQLTLAPVGLPRHIGDCEDGHGFSWFVWVWSTHRTRARRFTFMGQYGWEFWVCNWPALYCFLRSSRSYWDTIALQATPFTQRFAMFWSLMHVCVGAAVHSNATRWRQDYENLGLAQCLFQGLQLGFNAGIWSLCSGWLWRVPYILNLDHLSSPFWKTRYFKLVIL